MLDERLDRFGELIERTRKETHDHRPEAVGETTITEPSDLEIRVERVFDAPRDLVYAVFPDPKLIPEWWGERHDHGWT